MGRSILGMGGCEGVWGGACKTPAGEARVGFLQSCFTYGAYAPDPAWHAGARGALPAGILTGLELIAGYPVGFPYLQGFQGCCLCKPMLGGAEDGGRTRTLIAEHGILSPGRLPIPPLRPSLVKLHSSLIFTSRMRHPPCVADYSCTRPLPHHRKWSNPGSDWRSISIP